MSASEREASAGTKREAGEAELARWENEAGGRALYSGAAIWAPGGMSGSLRRRAETVVEPCPGDDDAPVVRWYRRWWARPAVPPVAPATAVAAVPCL